MDDPPPSLTYFRPPPGRSRLQSWGVAVLSGAGGGILIASSSILICFTAIAIGFLVGALSAFSAGPQRPLKFMFGVIGVGICMLSTLIAVTYLNWRGGSTPSITDLFTTLGFIGALVGLPGLCGAFVLTAVSEPRA